MGDSVQIPWDLSGHVINPMDAAAAGLAQGQRVGALHALHGLDLNSPDSMNRTVDALARVGALDQAGGVLNLNVTRDIARRVPSIMDKLDRLGGSQTPQTPDPAGTLSDNMSVAARSVDDLLQTPAADRPAKFAEIKKDMLARGVPEAAIDAAGSDLSDQHLQGLKAYYDAHAAHMNATLNPTEGVTSTPPALDHPTGYAWTRDLLNDPGTIAALGMMKSKFGLDTGLLDRAQAIALPEIQRQAEVQTAGPIEQAKQAAITAAMPEQAGIRVAEAGATESAKGAAQLGYQPALSGAVAGAQAAATAPYELVPNMTGPNGEPLYRTRADVAAGNIPAHGASPATIAASGVSGQQNAQQALALQARAADVPMRKAALENLRSLAPEFAAGPHSGFWKGVGGIAAQYGIPVPNANLAPNAIAAQEEFDKLSIAVLAAQRASMGLPVTDASSAMTAGAVPNERLTPKGIQRVTGLMIGNEEFLGAQNEAWQKWSQSGHGGETFGAFQAQFNRLFDPRVFQAEHMTSDQRAAVRRSVGPQSFDRQEAAAKRLGWIGRAQ